MTYKKRKKTQRPTTSCNIKGGDNSINFDYSDFLLKNYADKEKFNAFSYEDVVGATVSIL